ncbi:hypothetical protein U4E84_09625 [Halorubrum sp. AD140]|uniref:hypothetical protein n=1 Tax=Halorubrum sp. AD140 TaxID=3050073 RepID=UPI002ACC669F|nr:hypothetical protein [Halorubrum sp. AD140]MDZ5811602.1 hypothetical protein [Halorubrum sp. AD140]
MVVATVAVLALLAVAGASGMAVAQDGENGSNVTEVEDAGPYSLDELDNAGVRASESGQASTRQWGDAGSLWVRYVPTGIAGSASESSTWSYLEPGATIERTSIYLGGAFGWGSSGEDLDVTLVYWSPGEVEAEDEDGNVREEPAAVDQEVRKTSVEIPTSYAEEEIELKPSYDEPRKVTMFVEGSEGEATWTFDVHTSRTAEPVAVDTRSDLAMWIAAALGGALITILASLYVARQLHRNAGAGPGYPLWLYGAAFVPIAFLTVAVGFQRVLNTVAEAPWILIPPVAFVTVVAAVTWWGDETRKVTVIDLDLTDPDVKEDGSGSFPIAVNSFPLAEVGGAGREKKEGVVLEGIGAYLARTRGAIPEWDIGDEPSVTYDGRGSTDEVVFTDPFDDDPISFEREGWSIDHLYRWPDQAEIPNDAGTIDRLAIYLEGVAWAELFAGAAIVSAGYLVGEVGFSTGLLGAAVAVVPAAMYVARPVKGTCEVNAAPGAFGSVLVQMITAGEELEKLADRQFFKQKYFEERGSNVAERKAAREESELSKFDEVMANLESGEVDLEDVLEKDGVSGGASADD